MKLMILDDHQMFATMIQLALADFATVETFTEAGRLEQALKRGLPDILLMDVNLGKGQNGLEVGCYLAQTFEGLCVVYLSAYGLVEYHEGALKSGAKGFINKKASIEELKSSLTRIKNGERIFPKIERDFEALTPTEKAVLKLLSKGMNQEEVAEARQISKRTVNAQVASIKAKLGVDSLNGMIVKGMEIGVIDLPV